MSADRSSLDLLRAAAAMVLLGSAASLYADEVYKSIDAEGHVVYSDRGTSKSSQKSAINVIQSDPAEAARAAKEQAILKAEDDQRSRKEALESRAKAQQDSARKARCESARSRYNSIKDANLLYRLDEQGSRVYYTDAEADARRESARQAMTAACGP